MKFITITTLVAAIGVAAMPSIRAVRNDVFGVMALRSASNIHFAPVSAAKGGLFLRGPQAATCDGESPGGAYFYIEDASLYLYGGGHTKTVQQVFVDRSDANHGKLGYVSQGRPPPAGAELKGWTVNHRYLNFDGAGLVACPAGGNGYSIWSSKGAKTPQGCTAFNTMVARVPNAVGCEYAQ